MTTKLNFNEIKKRANHAAFQDGLTEILMGLFLFFYGGALATNSLSAGVVFIIAVIFTGKPVIERIKKHYIYPRTGYVRLPPDPNTTAKGIGISALLMVVALLTALGLSMVFLGQSPGLEFFLTYIVPPVSGFMLAIGPFWLGQTYGMARGYLWAALFVLGGIAMPVFGIASGYEAVGLICTVMGLITMTTGTIVFARFIRSNPPADPFDIEEATHA